MAVYSRPLVLPPAGVVTWPVCITGADVPLFTMLLVALEMVTGAIAGGLIGFVLSFAAGPEGAPQMAGFAIGLFVGAVGGTIAGAVMVSKGGCPCPPPATGFCVCLLFLVAPGVPGPIPLPPFFIPCPGECVPPPAGLVPPGCP